MIEVLHIQRSGRAERLPCVCAADVDTLYSADARDGEYCPTSQAKDSPKQFAEMKTVRPRERSYGSTWPVRRRDSTVS